MDRQANFWDGNKAKCNFIHKHKPGIGPSLCQVTSPRILSILVTLEVLWKSDTTQTGSPALNTLYLVNMSSVRVPDTSSIVAILIINPLSTLNVKNTARYLLTINFVELGTAIWFGNENAHILSKYVLHLFTLPQWAGSIVPHEVIDLSASMHSIMGDGKG